MFAAANPPKRYWETPGAQHTDLEFADGDACRKRLFDFLASSCDRRQTDRLTFIRPPPARDGP